jgi:ABC-2 type transport system permease protein
MVEKNKHKRGVKAQIFLQLAILGAALIIVNLLASQYYKRFDLTKEKRFTLSTSTEELVKNLNTNLTFNVYLDGELNPKFKQLKYSLRDLLQEISSISKGQIQYTFIDPFDGKSSKEQQDIIKQLESKGLIPHYDQEEDASQSQIRRLFPGAEVLDGSGNSYILNFLTTELGRAEETAINKSIENLEYELANVIRKAGAGGKNRKIGFLQGHGELSSKATADIRKELETYYTVRDVAFNLSKKETILPFQAKLERSAEPEKAIFKELLNHLNGFKGLIMAKPTQPFSKAEAYILDQYIMNGGKLLFLIDPVFAEYDTLAKYEKMLATNYELGELQNMLYLYGVRMNSNMLTDLNCHYLVFQSPNGLLRQFPWIYYPVFIDKREQSNPISKNIEGVWGRFASTLKPLTRDHLKHTVLLESSENTRISNSPLMLDLGIITQTSNPNFIKSFTAGKHISGLLSEGSFTSIFKDRNTAVFTGIDYKDHIDQNAMIIIADGDLIKNQVQKDGEGYFELGLDLATKKKFGNKMFLLNCIDYLCDGSGLIEIRNKEYQLRLLNQNKIKASKKKWQFINIAVPIILVILFGLINAVVRKRKYAK